MYFNDVHIIYYVIFAIVGLIVGQITGKLNAKIIENRNEDKQKEKKDEGPKNTKYCYLLMLANAVIYVILLYTFGLQKIVISNIELIQYLILTPFLLSVIQIDIKLNIIPNRTVLSLFEIGIFFVFIYGLYDINIALNRLVGMLLGAAIFLIITLLGNLISGKETMGYGDVKFLGALGLYFGMHKIIILSMMSFIIGAIIGLILMIARRKKMNGYMAFGPFISLSSFIIMCVPFDMISNVLYNILYIR